MAIEIRETFQVQAPIDAVWRFVTDPDQVVPCIPGAELDRAVDEHTFLGRVRIKLGAITTSYQGEIRFTELDGRNHSVRMLARGRETGGGTAQGSLRSCLRALPGGQTEVVAEASVELTGRVVQVGRGMIQGVARQLFQQFASRARERLETTREADAPVPVAAEPEPARLLPMLLRALWSPVARLFSRLRGHPGD